MTRDLRLLSAAIAVSAAGDMLLMVVLALRVHELTGSGFAVAGLFAALMVPVVVLAGWAGRLVDRVETRRVLLLVSSAQVAVAGGLVFADGVASILVLTALLGATAAVAGPAEAALVPAVAAGGDLTRANGWVETARYVGFTAGPLLASVLIAAGGTGLGLIVNAASFGVVAAAAALLRARRVPSAAARRDAGGGLPLLLGDAVLRAALVPAVAALLFIAASLTVEVFYVRDVVGAGPAGYSLVIAGWTAGMVLGAVAFAPRVTAPLAVAALAALALQGGGMAASALWAILPWAFAGYFVGGVGHGIKNVLLRTLIQRRVPADAHGRAFAAYNAARNTAELGALGAGGVLVGVLGAQPALILAGLGPVIAAAIGLALLRPRRRALEPAFAAR
ncbi:MFS transporter [Solirubrobacter sp. CPCC 204708]|nr:MFS transporter [Solirubrobacter deserti]